VKKIAVLVSLIIMVSAYTACAKPDYKKTATDFLSATSKIKDYSVREVADTESPDWKAVIVYAKQGMANMPIVLFVSTDGKSVVPNSMVFVGNKPIFNRKLEPELGKLDFKLTEKDRIVYNPSGKKTVVMFTDPDCPYCKSAMEKIRGYTGEYKIVQKYFPLEQIHPGATKKAIAEQAEWLKKNKLASGANALAEATKMVEQDIQEAQKAGVNGVPTYVMEDGSIKQGLF